jgi:heme/copper-type cytochrome/quinol oxidase subunit 1
MYNGENQEINLVWTRRFITAAIVQGAIIVGLTVFIIFGEISILEPGVSRVIAAGGAGTWFALGYVLYIVIGVIGVAVSALFYLYIERVLKKQYKDHKGARVVAWIHLILMNIGATIAMGMLMLAGYRGGAAMLPTSVGGLGLDAGQTHEILAPFIEPIAIAILVLIFGIICGGIGFLLVNRKKDT